MRSVRLDRRLLALIAILLLGIILFAVLRDQKEAILFWAVAFTTTLLVIIIYVQQRNKAMILATAALALVELGLVFPGIYLLFFTLGFIALILAIVAATKEYNRAHRKNS